MNMQDRYGAMAGGRECGARAARQDRRVCESGSDAGRTGLEVSRHLLRRTAPPAIGDTLDFVPIHIEYAPAVFQGTPITALQPLGRSTGLVRNAPRFGRWARRAFDAAGRQGLHHAGTQTEFVRALTDAVRWYVPRERCCTVADRLRRRKGASWVRRKTLRARDQPAWS